MKTRRRGAEGRLAAALLTLMLFVPTLAGAQKPDAAALKKQGDEAARAGSSTRATENYRRALALDPNYQDAYAALSVQLLKGGQFTDAVKLLRDAVRRLPSFAEGWYNLAYALRKLGQLDDSVAAYRRAAALQPKSADPQFGLGLALQAQGDLRGAAAAFRRYALLESNPAKQAWIDRALKLAVELEGKIARAKPSDSGQPAAASRPSKVSKVVKASKPAPTARRKTASQVDERVDEDEVLDPYTRSGGRARAAAGAAAKPTPPSASVTPERQKAQRLKSEGDRLAQAGRFAEAATKYGAAVAADYTYVAALNELGNVLFALHRYGDAIQTFRVAIRDNPDYHLGWYNLAYALRKANRLPEAAAAYRKFIQLEPNDPDPHFGLGLACQALGRKDEAVVAFKQYVQKEKRPAQERWVHRALTEIAKLEGKPAPPYVPGTLIKEKSVTEAAGTAASRPLSPAELAREAKRKAAEAKKQQREAARLKAAEEKKAKEEARRAAAEEKKQQREAARLKAAEEKKAKEEARRAAAEEKKRQREAARLAAAEEKKVKVEARAAVPEKSGKPPGPAAGPAAGPATSGSNASDPFVPPKRVAPAADTIESPALPPAPSEVPSSQSGRLRAQGDTLARVGKCALAAPLYKQASELDPFDTRAYDGIAHCAFRLGAYANGAALISLALRDNPDYDAGWLHLARLDRAAGRPERAVGSYRKYLGKQPAKLEAQLELARTLKSLGLKGQAIVAYQDYLRRERRPRTDSYRLAAYQELKALGGSPPTSMEPETTSKAGATGAMPGQVSGKVRAQTESDRPRINEEVLLRTMSGRDSVKSGPAKGTAAAAGGAAAVAAAKAAQINTAKLKTAPGTAAAKPRVVELASSDAPAAAAEASTEKPKTRAELRAEARRRAAEERKAKEEARRERDEARRKAAEERKANAEARRMQRKAGKGKPAGEAETLAAEVSRDLGESTAPAEPALRHDVLKPAPDAARGLVGVADGQFAKHRYDVALGIYQQACQLDPSASEPLYKAGVAAVALGQMHLAADLFARVLQLDPGNATAAVNLKMARAAAQKSRPEAKYLQTAAAEAQASVDAGRYALALQQSEKLLRLEPSARLYLVRAQARLGLKQPQVALQDAGRAMALDPTLLGAFRAMADAHRQLGARDRAIYYLKLYLARGESTLSGEQRTEATRAIKELSRRD